MCKIINLYGGPGVGKSTTAAELFAKMKKEGYKVELVREYAKDLVYDKRHNIIEKDQLYIFAKQNRRMKMLHDEVDYIITDSPLLLSITYGDMYKTISQNFKNLIMEYYNKYDNVNILLIRDLKVKPYQEYGRTQTKEESIGIDLKVYNMLRNLNIDYYSFIYTHDNLINEIFDYIKNNT